MHNKYSAYLNENKILLAKIKLENEETKFKLQNFHAVIVQHRFGDYDLALSNLIDTN